MSRPTPPSSAAWRRATPPLAAVMASVVLSGCQLASSPVAGFGGFIGDTHTFTTNPNRPPGADENMRHVEGRDVALPPLLPEPGDIWPGPVQAPPTLEDIQKQQNQEEDRIHNNQTPQPARGSSTPPDLFSNQPPPLLTSPPQVQPSFRPTPPAPLPPVVTPTPSGPLVNTPGAVPGGPSTAVDPTTGAQSIIVPNGNGTSTVIGPDGSTRTIPAPR